MKPNLIKTKKTPIPPKKSPVRNAWPMRKATDHSKLEKCKHPVDGSEGYVKVIFEKGYRTRSLVKFLNILTAIAPLSFAFSDFD